MGCNGPSFYALGRYLRGDRFKTFDFSTAHNDMRPGIGHGQGGRTPNASTSSGNDGDFTIKGELREIHYSFLSSAYKRAYPAIFIDRREAQTGSIVVNYFNAYFTVTTGQWAFKIRYWAVEPKNNLLTLDRFRIPMMISSTPFSLA